MNRIDLNNPPDIREIKKIIASDLLSIEAVFLRPEDPFVWASDIRSPIYCDNRLTLTSPEIRDDIEAALAIIIKEYYPSAEVLMGTATAGIAHAAITAHIMGKPMGYVRSSAKDHGRKNLIEGRLSKGARVVIIEDLISTAGSAIRAVDSVRAAGGTVLGIASIFTYGMKESADRLIKANVTNVSLTDFDTVVSVAETEGYVGADRVKQLFDFRSNPSDASWMEQAEPGDL